MLLLLLLVDGLDGLQRRVHVVVPRVLLLLYCAGTGGGGGEGRERVSGLDRMRTRESQTSRKTVPVSTISTKETCLARRKTFLECARVSPAAKLVDCGGGNRVRFHLHVSHAGRTPKSSNHHHDVSLYAHGCLSIPASTRQLQVTGFRPYRTQHMAAAWYSRQGQECAREVLLVRPTPGAHMVSFAVQPTTATGIICVHGRDGLARLYTRYTKD